MRFNTRADEGRVAVAGISRGRYLALQFAAAEPPGAGWLWEKLK